MNIDNTLYNGRPTVTRSEVEMAIYDKLDSLGIEYRDRYLRLASRLCCRVRGI